MKIEDTGLEGIEIDINELDFVMEELGFLRWAWDYKRATYDYRYQDKHTGVNIYLRIPSHAVEGVVEDNGNAILKLEQPYMGKHTYPHGMDYEYDFPKHILNSAQRKLQSLSENIKPGA